MDCKKVLILSGYGNNILRPFGESMREILKSSFNDLKIVNQHIYCDAYVPVNVSDTLIIFMMPPERIQAIKKVVAKNNNTFVVWNLEPFCLDGYSIKKYSDRRDLMREIINDKDINHVWTYCSEQEKYFNTAKCSFLPIGYHKCLEPSKRIKNTKKTNRRMFVMLGHITSRRKEFVRVFRSKLRIKKLAQIRPKVFDFRRFKSVSKTADEIGRFWIALDLHSTDFNREHIQWHRIMVYAAAGLVTFTDSDLTKYGFKNGAHYFNFTGADDCAVKMNGVFDNLYSTCEKVGAAMMAKLKSDFYMPNMLKGAIEKIK